jgi:hypothetical protein
VVEHGGGTGGPPAPAGNLKPLHEVFDEEIHGDEAAPVADRQAVS